MKQHEINYLTFFQFVAHPNVQQLLAALWYAGLPGFRRLPLMSKLFQLLKARKN